MRKRERAFWLLPAGLFFLAFGVRAMAAVVIRYPYWPGEMENIATWFAATGEFANAECV